MAGPREGGAARRDRGREATPPAAGLGRVGAEPGSRRPPGIWPSGRGTLFGSGVQIRCEQAQTQEVTIAPGTPAARVFRIWWRSRPPGRGSWTWRGGQWGTGPGEAKRGEGGAGATRNS